MVKSLNCPNCAAPLNVREQQTIALCVYCGSSIRLDIGDAQPQAIEQRELTPEVLSQVNQMLLDGKRAAAIELYRQQANVTDAEATEAIENLAKQMTRRTISQQPISNMGIIMLVVFSAVGLAAVWWGIAHDSWLAAIIGAGWAVLQWVVFSRGLQARWFYETALPATASVKKMVHLGDIVVRGKPAAAVRLWLEVRPSNQAPFYVERNMMMWRYSFEQLSPGVLIEVRCKPDRGEAIPTLPLKVVKRGS
jgi:hypothetical protein